MDIILVSEEKRAIIIVNKIVYIKTTEKSTNYVIISGSNIAPYKNLRNIPKYDILIIATCGTNNYVSHIKKHVCNNYAYISNLLEKESRYPIMYPPVTYTQTLCKDGFIGTPQSYKIFTKDIFNPDEIKHKCALESYLSGHTTFALKDNGICYPVTTNVDDYADIPTCLDGLGNVYATSIYKFMPQNSKTSNGVLVDNKMINLEGEYYGDFHSIKVPQNYIVYLMKDEKLVTSLMGPTEINITDVNRLRIQNYVGGVIFSEGVNSPKFYLLDRGSHMLDKAFWLTISYVKFIDTNNIYSVEMYGNMNFTQPINNTDNANTYTIFGYQIRINTIFNDSYSLEFPSVVRSVIIK